MAEGSASNGALLSGKSNSFFGDAPMQSSNDLLSILFMCAFGYLIARWVWDKIREARGIPKSPPAIDLRGMGWPYLKAVVAGAVFVFVMWEIIPGSPMEHMGGPGPSSWMVRLAVVFSIVPLVMIMTPFVIIAAFAVRAIKLRRGVADVTTGVLGATLGPLGSVLFGGGEPMPFPQAVAFVAAFPFAGAVAGFVFWRAVGYPGVARSSARNIERVRGGAERIGDAAGGSMLGVGLAAHAMMKREQEEEAEDRPALRRARPAAGPARKGFGKRAT